MSVSIVENPVADDADPAPAAHPRGHLLDPWVIAALTAVISGAWAGRPSLWFDEGATITASASRTLPELWKLLGHIDAVHGLYYLLMHGWFAIFPATEFWSRVPSALAVGAAAAGVVVFAKQFCGRTTAVCAGAVFAILPRITWAGIEARSSALVVAVAAWLTVLVVAAVRRNRARLWVSYALLLMVAILVNVNMVLLVAVYGAILPLLSPRGARKWPAIWLSVASVVALGGQIHTVIATTWILGVAMPSGYPHPPAVRRELFDRVCRGVPLFRAAQDMGVSTTRAWVWWRDAGAMKLHIGGRGEGERGLVEAGNMSLPGGRGHRLSVEERVEIMRGRDAGLSDAEIADQLGRDRTTIYRETRRNCNADGDYHALMAHARAGEKARRPKEFKLNDPQLCAAIERWMDDGWSPKLIAEMLARDHPDDKLARVSHETIYTCLYVQGRGQLRAELNKCLSTKRTARKPRGSTERRGKFSDVITISQRPAVVDDRAVPGHWESQWCCQAA